MRRRGNPKMATKITRTVIYILRSGDETFIGLNQGYCILGLSYGESCLLSIVEAEEKGRLKKLKCWARFFDAVRDGRKTFELRKDDRVPQYAVGDVLEIERVPDAN